MTIRITDPEDVKLVKDYAIRKQLTLGKAVIHAIKESDQLPYAMGEAATAKFMLRAMREDWYTKKPR
jgi:hypothetical protein